MKIVRAWFAALLCVSSGAQAQGPIITIGHAAPMTGRPGADGASSERAARMAVDEINQRGLVLGGQRANLTLASVDDGANSELAMVVAKQLVDAGAVAVVGHLASGTSGKAGAVYARAGVVQISPFATNPSLSALGYPLFFRTIASDVQAMQVLGEYAARLWGYKRVSVLDAEVGSGPSSVEQAFIAGFERAGGQVLVREEISSQPDDLRPLIERLTAQKPDAIFLSGFDGFGGRLLAQMKAMNVPGALLGSRTLCTGALAFHAQGSLPSRKVLCSVAGNLSPSGNARYQAFARAYQTRWGTAPEEPAAHAYDAVYAIAAAMRSADSADPKRFGPLLRAQGLAQGVSGSIAFDERGDLRAGDVSLLTYTAKGREVLAVVLAQSAGKRAP
jgi:branched-chain amino acid transport system substrate-binding protein